MVSHNMCANYEIRRKFFFDENSFRKVINIIIVEDVKCLSRKCYVYDEGLLHEGECENRKYSIRFLFCKNEFHNPVMHNQVF